MLLKVNDLIEFKKGTMTFEVFIKNVNENNYGVHLRRCTFNAADNVYNGADRFKAFDNFQGFNDKYFQERNYKYLTNNTINWESVNISQENGTWLEVCHRDYEFFYYYIQNTFSFGTENKKQMMAKSFPHKNTKSDYRNCLLPGAIIFPEPGFFLGTKMVSKPLASKWCKCC